MLLEYIDSTYIRTSTLLKVNLSSTDFNAFSSANMLSKLMDMRNTYLSENEALLSRYAWGVNGYNNGYDSLVNSVKRKNVRNQRTEDES